MIVLKNMVDTDENFALMQQLVAEAQCFMDDIAVKLMEKSSVKTARILDKSKSRLIGRAESSWRQFGYFPHIRLDVAEKAERDYMKICAKCGII